MTRVLIVDDSPLMRRLLAEVFAREGDFEVATARDGQEALGALESFGPDVITLDVHMPNMDGIACLDRIMVDRPTPVVMVSSLTREGADTTLKALELGAVDVVAKPSGAVSLKMDELGPELVSRVRSAATVSLPRVRRLSERLRARAPAERPALPRRAAVSVREPAKRPLPQVGGPVEGLVVVGASTGGPPALDLVLSVVPADFPWPILVAQHMPATFTEALARRLDRLCALHVMEVRAPTRLQAGAVYVGRGDADMVVSRRGDDLVAMAAPASEAYRWHPSVERLTRSAMALVPAERLAGVLLTGMGDDGAAAMTELRAAGGFTVAESQDSAVVWGMPGALVRAGGAELVAPVEAIAAALIASVRAR